MDPGHPAPNGTPAAPLIPHISANMIPLSRILFFYAQNAYQRLTTTIENLSSTVDIETDAARKRTFLATIIDLRHDFVKLYTLVKWAANAKDVSKLIDLLNWLRHQEHFFDQLGLGLNELNRYSGAKLPNPDIPTALEVLLEGRPQLPSYNLLRRAPVLPQRTLQVLRDLNICLTARMVFEDLLPARFGDYVVRDGRIYFTVPREFEVSVTAGNDTVVESAADYYRSPYYFIDFKFLFGVSADGETLVEDGAGSVSRARPRAPSLSAHSLAPSLAHPLSADSLSAPSLADSLAHTALPPPARRRLEHAANAALLAHGLAGLYNLLHRYAVAFKLYLLSRQLAHLCTISKWKGSVQYKYFGDRLVLAVNYWSQQPLLRNWRSFVEVGVTRANRLGLRWFRNGRYQNHDIDVADRAGPAGGTVLSLDMVLSMVANRHTESLVRQIHDQLVAAVDAESAAGGGSAAVSLLTPHQLLLAVAPKTLALFALNPLTGLFYFGEPSPLYSKCASRVNAPPPSAKSSPFVSEADTVSHVVASILRLRLDTFSQQIHNRLVTTEWIHNTIIKLSEAEIARLDGAGSRSPLHRLHFYRCKNWPSSWFLIILCSGTSFSTSWWVTRIKSIRGDWRIQWLRTLACDASPQKLDYSYFSTLATRCSNLIIDHIVHEELEQRNIRFVNDVDESIGGLAERPKREVKQELANQTVKHEAVNPPVKHEVANQPVKQELSEVTPSTFGELYSLTIALYNDGSLLPISASSTAMFLKITLVHHHNSTHMKLVLMGELRGIDLSTTGEQGLSIFHRNGKTQFSLTDSVDLSGTMNDTATSAESKVLANLFNSLHKLKQSIILVTILNEWNIDIVDYSADGISLLIDDAFGVLKLQLPLVDTGAAAMYRVPSGKNVDLNIEAEIQIMLTFVNEYLSHPQKDCLIGLVQYLRCIAPVFRAISAIKKSMAELDKRPEFRLVNNVRRLDFDVKFRELNYIQFAYYIKYTSANAPKRILKDKIVICLCLRVNKFARRQLYLKMSLRTNANHKNLKHKKLFEMIFRAINEFEVSEKLKRADLVKLNYEFLVEYKLADKLLTTVLQCFTRYVKDMPDI